MTYPEAVDFLYSQAPLFQNVGQGAYKEGLSNTLLLDEHFGHPHRAYRTIHVAGTNGKGSVCHTLAAMLQASGLRVGLYTSPHLLDFRERIRVNGQMIPEERVVRFIEEERHFFQPLHPSFFEVTTALAFLHFREQRVDVAVVEVGLGGRLDCTNIISPALSIITNISLDHTQLLGDTLPQIAREKAGIIKPHTPLVVGEAPDPAVRQVFTLRASELEAPVRFADDAGEVLSSVATPEGRRYVTRSLGTLTGELPGDCQTPNTATTLTAVPLLREAGFSLTDDDVRQGFANVTRLTGLQGRWQRLATRPTVICDTGHNIAGLTLTSRQLTLTPHRRLFIVLGMAADKDIASCLDVLPRQAHYIFTQASVRRALPAPDLQALALRHGLSGEACPTVAAAYGSALSQARPDDLIFVGGSTFVVADLLSSLRA